MAAAKNVAEPNWGHVSGWMKGGVTPCTAGRDKKGEREVSLWNP